MSSTAILLDSGYLYALFDADDRYHLAVSAVMETQGGEAIVPDVRLVEALFLVRRSGGIPAMIRFLEAFEKAGFRLEALQIEDIRRARGLIETYADVRLDFVDTCIIAIAERLDVRRIGTIDRRDFLVVRPSHHNNFVLFPPQL